MEEIRAPAASRHASPCTQSDEEPIEADSVEPSGHLPLPTAAGWVVNAFLRLTIERHLLLFLCGRFFLILEILSFDS